jgi:PST family polysaccharide transporter
VPRLRHAVAVLGTANLVAVAAPLATVPYLARTLGPAPWGAVLLAQALVAWVVLLLDFASDLHGARALGQAPLTEQGAVVWGVQGGKLLLVPVALVVMGIAVLLLPPLRPNPALAAWSVVAALSRGVSPLWAIVARAGAPGAPQVTLRRAMLVDTLARVTAALGVLLVVHHPTHGWRVLALQGVTSTVALGWLWPALRRELPPPPRRNADGDTGWLATEVERALRSLRRARALFAFRALGTVYQSGALLLLGALAPVTTVAAYGAADRLVRAAINLLDPLSRALLPRMARWHAEGAPVWEGTVTKLLWWLGGGSLLTAMLVVVSAPVVVPVLFGKGYANVVPLLRALALLLPVVTVATVLGFYWALPAGRDGLLLRATALAGAVNLLLVMVLVPRWGGGGMAGAVLAAEGVMVAMLAAAYRRRGRALR